MNKANWIRNGKIISEVVKDHNPKGNELSSDVAYALIKLKVVMHEMYDLIIAREDIPAAEETELDIITDTVINNIFNQLEEAERCLLRNIGGE